MNPADEDHWTYEEFLLKPDFDERFPLVQKQVWHVPYGENPNLKDESRQAAIAMYAPGTAEYIRYVEGRFAPIMKGISVTPQYDRSKHMIIDRRGVPVPLAPADGLTGFAFFDSWSNPACVLGQKTKHNRLVYLDTFYIEGSDIVTLLETLVIPMIESPRWKGACRGWRIGGDATMMNMDQSDRTKSAAKIVEKFFPSCRFEPGPREWRHIEGHLPYVLTHNTAKGNPLILLSGDNRLLDKALSGGWHYRKDNSGKRTSQLPVKDSASHYGDAFASAACRLLPYNLLNFNKETKDAYSQTLQRQRARAMGYITPNSMRGI
jgi:hypothetical protein